MDSTAASWRPQSTEDLWGHMASVLVFATGLLFPLVYVIGHGWTLTGMYEESVGYRYFYSLRQMYGASEYVFLPQGQLPNIVNQVIQVLLTGLGYRPEVLFPRIDLFAYAAVAVAHLVAIVTFAWAVAPLKTSLGKVCAALFWLSLYYLPGASGAHVILQPDYHTWMISVGLVTAGVFARSWHTPSSWRFRDSVVLGLFAGLALGIKLTLLIFPGALGLALLASKRQVPRSIALGLSAVAVAQVVWFTILLIHYHGNLVYVGRFSSDLGMYLSTLDKPMQSYSDWVLTVLTQAPWVVRISVALPVLLLALVLSLRHRPRVGVIAALVAGAAAYHWVSYSRFVPATWLEAVVFVLLAVWGVARIGLVQVTLKGVPLNVVGAVALLVAVALGSRSIADQLANVGKNDAASHQLWRLLSDVPVPIAFLIPENHFRPLSVDSAIFKGGSDIFEREYTNPLIRRIVPGREYFVQTKEYYRQHPLALDGFRTVVFTVLGRDKGDKDAQVAFLEDVYSTSLRVFQCNREVDFIYQVIVICTRVTVSGHGSRVLVESPFQSHRRGHEKPKGKAVYGPIGGLCWCDLAGGGPPLFV